MSLKDPSKETQPTTVAFKLAQDLIDGVVRPDDLALGTENLPDEQKEDIERRLKGRERTIFNTGTVCGPG